MTEIVVLVPVYQRPYRVQPTVDSFLASEPTSARLLFIVSPEDKDERAALDGHPHLVMPHPRTRGDWARKINHGYRWTTEPWILCAADDIRFHPGWDRVLLDVAAHTGKRVIGTRDLNPHASGERIYSPHPLVARSYADELGTVDGPGRIFCELYDHNYPDRELAGTAIARDEWAFAKRAIIEHLHHGWTDTKMDRTYRLGLRNEARDRMLFEARRKQWQKPQAEIVERRKR